MLNLPFLPSQDHSSFLPRSRNLGLKQGPFQGERSMGLLENGQVNGTTAVPAKSPWRPLGHTLETTDARICLSKESMLSHSEGRTHWTGSSWGVWSNSIP